MERPAVKRMEVDREDGRGPTYPYLLGATLGEGAYGLVREGLDVSTAKVVAIKSLDRRLLKKQRRGLENLEREIRVHKRLGAHGTIVDLENVIDIKSKSRIHLVLEYMHCGSVQDVLDRAPGNRLGQAQARRYFAGLLAGLQYIHSRGAVHKDIKPANMMLNRNGEVRLSDFGCAEELDSYEASDAVTRTLGSPAFQSPEIARGVESFSGTATDVWAAGVTLFQMVVGRTPFDASNLVDLFEKIGEAKLELPESLGSSPALSDLLSRLLAPEADRLTVEQARSHPWMSVTLSAEEAGQEVEPSARQPTILKADFDALDLYPAENEKNLEDSWAAPASHTSSSGAQGAAGGAAVAMGASLLPDAGASPPLGGLFYPPAVGRSAATAGTAAGPPASSLNSLTTLFDPPPSVAGSAPLAIPGHGDVATRADTTAGVFEASPAGVPIALGSPPAVGLADVAMADTLFDTAGYDSGDRQTAAVGESGGDLFAELGLSDTAAESSDGAAGDDLISL